MGHEFSRTEMLIGKKGLKRLAESKIAIFGIGGVGSYAAEALARSGVGTLVLIDNDIINITNINRQIHSLNSTIGQTKVETMAQRIRDINPAVNIITHKKFFTAKEVNELIKSDYDYIIDAIDTFPSKVELIVAAKEMNIPIISSMGTGNKLDASKFQIADIYDTSVCPLAKRIRKELKALGIKSLKVVFSKEEPIKTHKNKTLFFDDAENIEVKLPDIKLFKLNFPGSISFVPSVAGLLMAGEVIKDIIFIDDKK